MDGQQVSAACALCQLFEKLAPGAGTSSPVEGRNGYLSRIHHGGRGLSERRLQVLTVIHNFALKRSDGSTAAERLFGRQFPDLFESIVEHMGELPLPRKTRKPARSKVSNLQAVPA